MATPSLTLLVIKTRRLGELVEFYRGLGIELTEEQHGSGPVHFAGRMGVGIFEVYPIADDGSEADSTLRLGFDVDGLEALIEALERAGTPITSLPRESSWGFRSVVRDPDGRAVELYERRPISDGRG